MKSRIRRTGWRQSRKGAWLLGTVSRLGTYLVADTRRGIRRVERADINARKYSVHRQKVTRYSIILVGTMQNRSKWLDFYLPSRSPSRSLSPSIPGCTSGLPGSFVSLWHTAEQRGLYSAGEGGKTYVHEQESRVQTHVRTRMCALLPCDSSRYIAPGTCPVQARLGTFDEQPRPIFSDFSSKDSAKPFVSARKRFISRRLWKLSARRTGVSVDQIDKSFIQIIKRSFDACS